MMHAMIRPQPSRNPGPLPPSLGSWWRSGGARIVPASLACITWVSVAGAAEPAAARPNILWITSEDNSPYLGCYGDPQALTPHLDRLAAEGVRYRHAFANAPVCSASRATLITGMYATSLGIHHHRGSVKIPARFPLYPELIRAAGYYTTNNSKTDYNLAGDPLPWDESSPQAHYRNRPAGQPFFAVFNLTATHESRVAPPPEKQSFRIPPEKIILPPYHPDTPEMRRDWANYHDQLTLMDGEAGRLLTELDRAGLADNTIVIYCSDHGGALGRGKRNLHDSGTLVPMIVRFPPKWKHLAPASAGEWVGQPVSFVDLPATFLNLLGIPVPENYEGRPFLGVAQPAPRDHVFLYRGRMDEHNDTVRAVRDSEFRYVHNYSPHRPWGQHYSYAMEMMPGLASWHAAYRAGRTNPAQSTFWELKPAEELYRLSDDPFELHNLALDPAWAGRLETMRRTLESDILATRDTGFIPEGMFDRLVGDRTIYDYAQSSAYPLARILDLAGKAASRDLQFLPELRAALDDPHPVVRYWGATGCLVLGARAAPAQRRLRELLDDEWTDVRVVAAEALGWLDGGEAALGALEGVVKTGNPTEVLAALEALEYLWRAGHVPLFRAQAIVRDLKLAEPGQRIPAFLLGKPVEKMDASSPAPHSAPVAVARPTAPWSPPPGPLRVIIDTDAANEIDDQYALALALGFPERLEIEGIVAAHFGDNGGPDGIDASHAEIERVLALAGRTGSIPVLRGSPPFQFRTAPPSSEGVRFIIERARAATPEHPLWLVLLGPATDAVAALLLEPGIADRLVVFWHGRTEWPDRCWNFNALNDPKAARLVFELPARFVLFDTGANLTMDMEEGARRLAPGGRLGAYLHDIRNRRPAWRMPKKGIFDLGDIAALIDPNSVKWEWTAAPAVGQDLRYDFRRNFGPIVRIHQVDRDRAFDLLDAALGKLSRRPP